MKFKIIEHHLKSIFIEDDEAESVLKLFREKRDQIAVELEIPVLDGESELMIDSHCHDATQCI